MPRPFAPGLALVTLLGLAAGCASSPEQPAGAASPAEPSSVAGIAPLVEQAEAHRARGEQDAAIALYREALHRTPWNERLKQALATTYAERAETARGAKNLGQAEADLRSAVEIAPGDPNLARNLAVVLNERAAREYDLERAASLRQEARALAPEVTAAFPEREAPLERRLDLAYELIQKDQLDAGIDGLERLRKERPAERSVGHLLAQAYVKRADAHSTRRDFEAAGTDLDRAVAVYGETFPRCGPPDCKLEEIEMAHWNRVVAWINASRAETARRALTDASAQGFSFVDLERALRQLEN